MSWDEELDRFEALLRLQEAVIERAGPLPGAWVPDVDGPIPDRLRARASALLARSEELEDRTAAAITVLRRRRPTFATGRPPGGELGRL